MTDIHSFKIDIPQAKLDRLNQKLALVDLPPEIEGIEPWARGVPLTDLKRVLNYWTTKYDWRKTEAKLNNDLPQFTTNIQVDGFGSLNMHFVHQQSKVNNAIPLLFIHGWPGNFTEVEKILPLLVSGDGVNTPAFHVVSPSLINFGFSDRATKPGFSLRQHAESCHKLMQKLGYEKYVIQGGDLGSFVARTMVQHYQPAIGGHLLNLCIPRAPTKDRDPELWEKVQSTPLTDEEKKGLERSKQVQTEGMGYYRVQETKPQTIGYSMADSPVGLLAWIYEKLHDWTDDYPWTEEEILQWVCIYYFSVPGPNATQHIYYESTHDPASGTFQNYSPVPLGVSRYPKELTLLPRLHHETMGPVVFWNLHESGGHFAANEKPEDIVQDLRTMFGKGGPAESCCGPDRKGYSNSASS